MRKLHVGNNPSTNRIYAGHVLKDGQRFGTGSQDVTGVACGAVAEHVLANNGRIVLTVNGQHKYEILVRELSGATATLAADAARYRWLKAQGRANEKNASRAILGTRAKANMAFRYWCAPEELDKLIDDAAKPA